MAVVHLPKPVLKQILMITADQYQVLHIIENERLQTLCLRVSIEQTPENMPLFLLVLEGRHIFMSYLVFIELSMTRKTERNWS